MKNIAIIMGGYSSEYKISLISGNVVHQFLDKTKYNGFRIHIFKEKWVYVDANESEFPIDKNDFSVTINGNKITFDCVFNAIHGTPGEDGLMQAYFELLNIPQTSCDYYQAALTFNKRDLLSVLKPYGIKTATSYYLNKGDAIHTDEIVTKVGLPCFVKPNKAGSSFGISKVKTAAELPIAIEVAYKEDNEIIIESFLDGTEVSVGVINYKGTITVLPITEIVSENDFFDYEAKYLGKSQEITPARISNEMTQKVSEIAKRAYEVLKMKGFSRSEFIIVNDEPHMLEMNTIPGLTTESLIPQQAKAAGISLKDLSEFDKALDFAFAEDKDILIESQLKGTEVSVGVMKLNGETKVLGTTEIISENDFFDYEAKYLGKSNEITPARLSKEVENKVFEFTAKIYEALGMQGFSRIDFIVMNDIPHFIEINTNPGLSPQSIFPQQAAYANLNFSDLLDNEIKLALERKPIWKK